MTYSFPVEDQDYKAKVMKGFLDSISATGGKSQDGRTIIMGGGIVDAAVDVIVLVAAMSQVAGAMESLNWFGDDIRRRVLERVPIVKEMFQNGELHMPQAVRMSDGGSC